MENQPVSEFVSNAAESAALQMNREDLRYQPVKKSTAVVKVATFDVWYQQRKEEQAKKQAEREEYWELVNYARNALFDYYGSGNRCCPGIILEYQDICKQGSDAILSKAQEMGMI